MSVVTILCADIVLVTCPSLLTKKIEPLPTYMCLNGFDVLPKSYAPLTAGTNEPLIVKVVPSNVKLLLPVSPL